MTTYEVRAAALAILEYHRERNDTAKQPHHKSGRKKRKKVRFKVLL